MAGGYTAPAEAFGSGLQQGINLHRQLFVEPEKERKREAEHAEDREVARVDRTRRVAKESKQQAEHDFDRQLRLSDVEHGDIQNGINGLIQQYRDPGKIPPQERVALHKRALKWREGRDALLDQHVRPRYEESVKTARKTGADLAGGAPLDKVPDGDFAKMIALTTGRDPKDFLDSDAGPSAISGAARQIQTAAQSGDWETALPAINTLYAGELRQGVGQLGRDGTPITSKEIVKIDPAPGEGKFIPRLLVKTVGNPNGYVAPPTRDRSSRADDNVTVLDLGEQLGRMQHLEQLATVAQHPEVRAKIERGIQAAGGEIESMLRYGFELPKRTTRTEKIPRGGITTVREVDSGTGETVRQEDFEHTEDPNKLLMVQAAAERAQVAAGSRERVAGIAAGSRERVADKRVAAKGGQAKPLTTAEQDKLIEDKARGYGIFKRGKDWKQFMPSKKEGGAGYYADLSPESSDVLARLKGEVTRSARPNAPGAGTQDAPRDPAARQVGTVYQTPRGPLKWMGNGWSAAQ